MKMFFTNYIFIIFEILCARLKYTSLIFWLGSEITIGIPESVAFIISFDSGIFAN